MKFRHFLVLLLLNLLSGCYDSERWSKKNDQNQSDSAAITQLVKKSKSKEYANSDSLKSISNQLLEIAQKTNSSRALIYGYINRGKYLTSISNFKEAIDAYSQSLELEGLTDENRVVIYNNLGNCYSAIGELGKAVEEHIRGLKIEDNLGNIRGASISQLNIAGSYAHLQDHEKSLEYAKKAYESSNKNHDDVVKMRSAFQMASVLADQGNDSLAYIYADTTRICAKRLGSEYGINKANSIIASILVANGETKEGLILIRSIAEFYKNNKLQAEYLGKKVRESQIILSQGHFQEARSLATQNLVIARKLGNKEQIALSQEILASSNAYLGDYKNAYTNMLSFHQLKDSLNGVEKSKTVQELETKYETEKKEIEIASLSQQASIQQLQIQQKNQTMLIGVVVFLLLAAVIYFIYREKNLRNQRSQTELEQRFLRSQLNPHFIFNALLAIQNFMLKNDGPKAALYLTKFSKLMREILESSRQEFIPLESEVELITNYLDIHKMRLNDAFNYSIEIDDQIDPETDTIPPMFVQPFVENAIEHGMADKKEGGLIEIKFQKTENHISIEILDNGKGLISTESKNHKSLASTIIRERMALFNKTLKNKIQLVLDNIQNEDGEIQGTKAELKVPFSYL
ncbi:MAG: histidine kinase [Cyclobacteriaceae bacterium]